MVQRHARLFAVLESLDNGKPIRESRDIDIPLVARHFYHHAGWAQLLEADAETATESLLQQRDQLRERIRGLERMADALDRTCV
jgi:acyl-CoA reductase-like NAD-dependent aldehyde dehydrogenase